MFGSDEDDRDLGDIVEGTQSRETRVQDRDCDICGASEGSVILDRDTDTARCNDCWNDPDTWEDDDGR